jgi:diguanylate cyclase (GGDEF)-like protein
MQVMKKNPTPTTIRSTFIDVTERGDSARNPACIVGIAGPLLGTRVELSEVPLLIGRSLEAGLTIPAANVSREHCKIQRRGVLYVVSDLGSTNKTYVNDQSIAEYALRDGDLIRVGSCVLKFFGVDSVEAPYQKQLLDLAVTDDLTGLSNRRQFLNHLSLEILEALRRELPLSLLIVDLDHFKNVNDSLGHEAGDRVLRAMGALITGALPPLAFAGRLGGEEFGIGLAELDSQAAHAFAEALRIHVEQLIVPWSSAPIRVTASIGGSSLAQHLTQGLATQSELLRVADGNLYRAKHEGRNCVRF